MKLKEPKNVNYAAVVVSIKNKIPLENSDNIIHTNIFGNLVIVSKDVNEGDMGIFFPVETQLSKEFLTNNNLYRDNSKNINKEAKGFFEDNGRIRAIKLRGNKSMGLWMPLSSLSFVKNDVNTLNENDIFDEINNIPICQKYYIPIKTQTESNRNKLAPRKKISALIENQFRLHYDTQQLGRNITKVNPDDIISITVKIHGTSLVASKVLAYRKLNLFEKMLKFLKVKIDDKQYKNIWSSRKVIKNDDLNPDKNNFYDTDIWSLANEKVKDYLIDGMTLYCEVVGFTPTGVYLQKGYDYKCEQGTFDVYVYRITMTNPGGQVVEFNSQMVQTWCKANGVKVVPELYYGKAKDLFSNISTEEHWHENFLSALQEKYLEKDCWLCNNRVPDEGIVLRVDTKLDSEAFKLKSFSFLKHETEMLDKGEGDIESSQSENNE